MVAETAEAVDVEGAVRQWARDREFTAFFGTNNRGSFPQVVIQRIDGPDDDCLIQFDVWAAPKRDDGTIGPGGSKEDAALEAARLATEIAAISSYDHDGVRLHNALWLRTRWLPGPESDRPRYIVEATFTATAL